MEKVVIVTGAGRGIARRVALDFAAQGCRVAVVDLVAERAKTTTKEIEDAGGTALSLVCDVRSEASVRDMVEQSPWGFLPVGLILTQNFDALSKIGEVKMPVLVTHGTRDSIVPFHMGERLYAAANAPKRFIKVEGAGHHNLSGAAFEQYRQALSDLFKLKRS